MMTGIMLHFGLREIVHIRRDQTDLKKQKNPQNKTESIKKKNPPRNRTFFAAHAIPIKL